MGIGVIAANKSIKVNQGNIQITAGAGASATYSVPSNGYLIISGYYQPVVGDIKIKVGSTTIVTLSNTPSQSMYGPYYLGSGTDIVFTNNGGASSTATIIGVEFINSP